MKLRDRVKEADPSLTRDPRLDPAFLDVVESGKGRQRRVEFVTSEKDVIYSTPSGHEKRCTLKTWKRWCQGGKIVSRGRADGGRLQYTATVRVGQEIGRELNLLRNRLDDGRCSDEEAIGALIEFGLSRLNAPYSRIDKHLRRGLLAYKERGRGVDPLD